MFYNNMLTQQYLDYLNHIVNVFLFIIFWVSVFGFLGVAGVYLKKDITPFKDSVYKWIAGFYFLLIHFTVNTPKTWKQIFIENNLYVTIRYVDLLGVYIFLICVISLSLCFYLMDNKIFILKKNATVFFYILFLVFLCIFITSNNIFFFFTAYECMMLPSIALLYFSSPNKRIFFVIKYFIIWTQGGSIFVLLGVFMLYFNDILYFTDFNSFNGLSILNKSFILFFFFLGFGIKIPIYPFYFWLTKTHVEANTSFSIFLSGFLVKIAFYGFFKIFFNLNCSEFNAFFIVITVLGILDSSIKILNQIDLKKIVALLTVQEMNIIFFFFFNDLTTSINIIGIFSFLHFIISFSFFYITDIIYRRFKSRSTYVCFGCLEVWSDFSIILILVCVLFLSLPFTFKFFYELYYLLNIFFLDTILFIVISIILLIIVPIFFLKVWFNLIFGVNNLNFYIKHLTKREIYIYILIIMLLCFFCCIIV